eukprot:jgi/Mesvir1/23209/Mv26045-RA.1
MPVPLRTCAHAYLCMCWSAVCHPCMCGMLLHLHAYVLLRMCPADCLGGEDSADASEWLLPACLDCRVWCVLCGMGTALRQGCGVSRDAQQVSSEYCNQVERT